MINTLNSGFIKHSRAKTIMIRFVTESKGFLSPGKQAYFNLCFQEG